MDLDDIRALISVIEHGSTQAAAAATRVSRTTLRRRLESLEAAVGVPLLVRGSGGAIPTPAGVALAERGRSLVQEASALVSAVRAMERPPEGQFRVLAPVGLPPHVLQLMYATAHQLMPRLEFSVALAEDPLRAPLDELDLILHFGAPPTHGPWVSTLVRSAPERVLASPVYLEEHGAPQHPSELERHSLLSWKAPGEDGRSWPLRTGGILPVTPCLILSDVHLLRQFAAMGAGLALLPDGGVPEGPDLAGELVPVLGEAIGRPNALRALVPEALSRLPKGRRMMALIKELLAGMQALA